MSSRQVRALFAAQQAGLRDYMLRRYRTTVQQAAFACRLP